MGDGSEPSVRVGGDEILGRRFTNPVERWTEAVGELVIGGGGGGQTSNLEYIYIYIYTHLFLKYVPSPRSWCSHA